MKKIFSIFTVLTFTNIFGQAPGIQWQKSLGGTNHDWGNAIGQTSDGGYIVAGASASFDGDVTNHHGADDYWIVKLNSSGLMQWEKSYGGSSDDDAFAIQQTSDGGYIVAGNSGSTDGDVTGNHGHSDCWVIKIDSLGNLQWQKSLGGSHYESANSIIQTMDGEYIMAGYSDSYDGDVSGGQGSDDYWIVKLDTAGLIKWQKTFGGQDDDIPSCLKATVDGGYVIAGLSYSTGGDVTNHHGIASYNDFWIIKIDSLGNLQWQKSLGGTYDDVAKSIEQTFDGGYIVVGHTDSNDGDAIGFQGWSDYLVIKLSANGSTQWAKTYGGTNNDQATAVWQTFDNDYIIAGGAASNDGDINGHIGSTNFFDNWLVKIDSAGSIKWERSYGGTHSDIVYAMQQTSDGGYITAGYSESIDGGITNHHGTISTGDYWVVKLFPSHSNIIEQVENRNTVLIYPNPAIEKILLNSTCKMQSINITNPLGENVYQSSLNCTNAEVALENLPNGTYFMQIFFENNLITRKITVQK